MKYHNMYDDTNNLEIDQIDDTINLAFGMFTIYPEQTTKKRRDLSLY